MIKAEIFSVKIPFVADYVRLANSMVRDGKSNAQLNYSILS